MPRWTVLLLLAMWVESEPERGASGLGGESKWGRALRITTDVSVKFLPLLVGAEWGRTALLLQNALELRWFTEHEARAMSRPS